VIFSIFIGIPESTFLWRLGAIVLNDAFTGKEVTDSGAEL
jgi:hypothetical protein